MKHKKKQEKALVSVQEPVRVALPDVIRPGFLPTDDLLETSLQQEVETENNIKSVSKELFNKKEVEVKTEVSHNEINNVTRLLFLEDRLLVSNVEVLIDNFLALRISKNRRSRREFVEALQTETKNTSGGGFLSKLFGGKDGGTP